MSVSCPVVQSPTTAIATRTRDRRLIAGALLLALAVRVVIVLATRHTYAPVDDAVDYSRIASSIAKGHGFGGSFIATHGPSAYRTPLWPALLGGVYAVTGTSWTMGRLFLAVVSTGFVGMVGAVMWQVAGRRVGLICLWAAAVYPPFLLAGYGLNYEVVMGLLFFAALFLGLRWREHPESWWLLVGAGVCSGLAVLCRENAGLVLVPIWIWIYQSRQAGGWGNAVRRLLAVTSCAALVVVPWTIRNAVELHAFIPVSDSPGFTVAGAYNASTHPGTPARMWVEPTIDPTDRRILLAHRSDNEAQLVALMQSAAVHYIKAHPSSVPKVVGWNLVALFSFQGIKSANWVAPYIGWPLHLVELSVVSFWGIGLIALFGLRRARARQIPWAFWALPILWCISVIFTVTTIQYRFVVEPFILLLAALAVVHLYERRPAAPT
jgi:4-amino-4-deoxy-L-arabinose transferase-like glycosyltransferase